MFIHYEIPNDKLNTPIDGQPFSPIVEPTEENIKSLFEDKEADLIVLVIIIRFICLMINLKFILILDLLD